MGKGPKDASPPRLLLWTSLVMTWVFLAWVLFLKRKLPPGFFRSYAFDVLVPAYIYVFLRYLQESARPNFFVRLMGRGGERIAVCLLLATSAAEVAPRSIQLGLAPVRSTLTISSPTP